MPRPCTICSHPERNKIEDLLSQGKLQQHEIAKRYGFSSSAVTRHKPHMLEAAAKVAPVQVVCVTQRDVAAVHEVSQDEFRSGQTAYRTLMDLKQRAERGLEEAEHAENDKAMAFWFRELRSTLELIFKVGLAQKQLEEQQHKDISPELQSRIDQVIGG